MQTDDRVSQSTVGAAPQPVAFGPVTTLAGVGPARARALAAIVKVHVAGAPNAPAYAPDLVRYQNAQLVLEAGPRLWRTDEPPPALGEETLVTRGADVQLLHFTWDLPAMLPLLLSSEPATEPPTAVPRETRLVLARTPRARVTVLRLDTMVKIILEAVAEPRTILDLAMRLALPPPDMLKTVRVLVDAGVLEAR